MARQRNKEEKVSINISVKKSLKEKIEAEFSAKTGKIPQGSWSRWVEKRIVRHLKSRYKAESNEQDN